MSRSYAAREPEGWWDGAAADRAGELRPGDAGPVPYHRLLTDDFRQCAAFRPAEYIGVDFQHRATRPTSTCRHLAVGAARDGEYYPACGLAGPVEREAWAGRVTADRC